MKIGRTISDGVDTAQICCFLKILVPFLYLLGMTVYQSIRISNTVTMVSFSPRIINNVKVKN